MRFVLTGRHPTPRAELARRIVRAGHIVDARITTSVNYLVRGNINDSEKIREARRAGVTVITYARLLELITPVSIPALRATVTPATTPVTTVNTVTAAAAASGNPNRLNRPGFRYV